MLSMVSRVARRLPLRQQAAVVAAAAPPQQLQIRCMCDSKPELTRQLSRTSSNIEELFSTLDTNGDGTITKGEFEDAMRRIGLEQLRGLQLSLSRNELSRTPSRVGEVDDDPDAQLEGGVNFGHRFFITFEVMVSKIFPAGFGWQSFSCIAEQQFGMSADSAAFALTTGFGDGLGVLAGHTGYYAIKSALVDSSINVAHQFHTGLLLGTAAFCSGTAWQPLVDMFTASGMSFNQAVASTVVGCGSAFFGGLRIGRAIYGPTLEGVESANYGNLKADGALSVAIGGATGAFVGTDVSFADNWMRPALGVEDGMSDIAGCVTAGTSTAVGFVALQTVENIVVPAGKNWVD